MNQYLSTFTNLIQKLYGNRQIWLVVIAVGVWMIVLQNFGIFSKSSGAQSVYVVGGDIDATVRGSVDVDNTVEVQGYVSVDGSVALDGGSANVWVDGGQINTW